MTTECDAVVGLKAGGQELGAEHSEMFYDLRGFSFEEKLVDCIMYTS